MVAERPDAILFFPVKENGRYITDPQHDMKNRSKVGFKARVIAKDVRRTWPYCKWKSCPRASSRSSSRQPARSAARLVHVVGNSQAYDETLWRIS